MFLDRDGVINRRAAPHAYIRSWAEFVFLDGVPQAIRRLNRAGYLVIVVTNQRGVARGLLSRPELDELHRRMCASLAERGARIDAVYVCPHEEGVCDCRKPGIGLLQAAERDHPLDRTRSWMIGDSLSDILAGRRFGVSTAGIDLPEVHPSYPSLLEAVMAITKGETEA